MESSDIPLAFKFVYTADSHQMSLYLDREMVYFLVFGVEKTKVFISIENRISLKLL